MTNQIVAFDSSTNLRELLNLVTHSAKDEKFREVGIYRCPSPSIAFEYLSI
jgi:hypothetical protein